MKVFENDADWEERAWELAKKLVSIDSSDPGDLDLVCQRTATPFTAPA